MKNNWFLGIFLGIILVTGVSSPAQIFADSDKEDKFKEKIDKIKEDAKNAPKDKKNKDRVEFEKEDTNSKKISKVLTKSIKNQKDRQEFGVRSLDEDGKTIVYLHLTDKDDLSEIPSQYEIIDYADNIAVAKLSLDEMNEIAELNIIETIGPLQKAVFYTHQVSEGVANTFADTFHAAGIDGTGVTVAVIDVSFHITDPEIAPNIISSQLLDSGGWCGGSIACGDAPGDSHGTAVAEIIVDMAPNVNLKLYAIGNSVDFNNAVDDAIANGADIITASLGFPTAGGDGVTGSFRDGTSVVAKKVNDANAAGLLFTVAAGNEGSSHWMGNYVPSPVTPVSIGLSALNESVMDFQPGATGSQRACLPVTDFGDLYVTSWDDWTVSNNDYDLYLFDSAMTTVLASGIDAQPGFPPIEYFFGINAGSACLVLASWETTENHFFHIDTESNSLDPSFRMRDGSISTPADASGSFSIGAMDVGVLPWDIESFSSAGPTDDGRAKPEICSFDGTFSHSNLNPFYGTSASTPHVAGAAALLIDQNPSISNTQIKNDLMGAAVNGPGNFAVPNLCGSGQMALGTLLIPPSEETVQLSESITLQDTIQTTFLGGTCGLSFPDGSTINYGELTPDELSSEITLNMTNSGSTIASLEVHGTDWKDISENSVMDVNRTHFSLTSGIPYSSNIHLELFDKTVTGSFLPSEFLQTFWQIEAILNQAFIGDITQTMDFTVSC